jgi:hypothetical protein
MTSEIDAAAEINRLRIENARLRAQLEQNQHRALALVRLWEEYAALGRLKEQLERGQWRPRRTKGNGHGAAPRP